MNRKPPPEDPHARLRAVRESLHRDRERLSILRAMRSRARELDALLEDLDRQIQRAGEATAVITLVGATGAGKSTLLNALAGAPVAREGIDRPTTTRAVIYAPEGVALEELLEGVLEEAEVVRHRARPPRPEGGGSFRNQILIDAPDLNSIEAGHRETVLRLADRSDVLLVVLHRQSVVEKAAVSFLDTFALRRRLVFVLNRIDELSEDAREEIFAQIRRLAAGRWRAGGAPILATSARLAGEGVPAPGWQELLAEIHGLAGRNALFLQRRKNASGIVHRVQALFREIEKEAGPDLDGLPEEVRQGLEQLAGRVADEVAERLHLRQADLTLLLRSETSKGWDGPGGWTLRSGGLGSLGLGAGALLLRRNPLLGAGAAAGALAVDGVQKVARRMRMEASPGLLPEPREFAAWHAGALAVSRVQAGRLTGDPELLGLPPAETLGEEAAGCVAEAWDHLFNRDLPAAAQGSIPRPVRFLLDLPVYALG
ncbi:MAG: GTPase, partial [Planctomycetota bacterium]